LGLLPETSATPAAWESRRSLGGAFYIKTDRIRPDPLQPRKTIDQEALAELTESIRQHGIIQPITVRYIPQEEIYQVITGERRFLAATAVGLAEIPCWEQTPKSEDILVQQVVENWQRADLHPFDLADTLVELRDKQNRSQKEIAVLTGKPESEISKILSLLKLNPAIQSECRTDPTGSVSRRHLENIAKLAPEEQVPFLQEVREQNLTAKETEKRVSERLSEKRGEARRGAPTSMRRTFATSKGSVTVSLRRKHTTAQDILDALQEARQQVKEDVV
jgi:ParB family transcriptional regulator, chromosome partitioning protein